MCKRSRGDGRNIKRRGNGSLRGKLAISRKRMNGVRRNVLRVCKEVMERKVK